jgi:hypothetical protein
MGDGRKYNSTKGHRYLIQKVWVQYVYDSAGSREKVC